MADHTFTPWFLEKLTSSALTPAQIELLCTAHKNGGLPYSERPTRPGSSASSDGILIPYWTPKGEQLKVVPASSEDDAEPAEPIVFTRQRLSDQLRAEWIAKAKAILQRKQQDLGLPSHLMDEPKEPAKYLSPRKSGCRLYHSHLAIIASAEKYQRKLNDTNTPLRLVEGEFKVEPLTIHDRKAITVGLGGVWNWKDRRGGGEDSCPIPELCGGEGSIPLDGREVRLCFDSDYSSNPRVRAALKALALHLYGLGARVLHELLPSEISGEKNGPDDLIHRHGPEAFHRIRPLTQPAVVMVTVGKGKDAMEMPAYCPPQEPAATGDSHRRAQFLLSITARHWVSPNSKTWRRWTGTHWETLRSDAGDAAVQHLFHRFRVAQGWEHCDGKTISSWMAEFRRSLPTAIPALPAHLQNAGVVPCSNGLLRLDTLELLPHDPSHGNTWCLQIPYDPQAPRGEVKRVLVSILGVAGAEQVMAALAATVRGTIGRYKLFIEIFGPGNCGKSLVALILQALVGLVNAAAGTLERLEDRSQRFETARFDGKRLAIFNEAQRYSGPLEMLKSFTGRDAISAEIKNGELYDFTFDGLVLMVGNSPINAQEKSDAVLDRRLQIGPLTAIPLEQQNPNLLSLNRDTGLLQGDLLPHLPGFLLELLEIPEAQIQQTLSTRARTDQQLENEVAALIAHDPVAAFLERELIFDPEMTGDSALMVGDWRRINEGSPSVTDQKLFLRFYALAERALVTIDPRRPPAQYQQGFRGRIVGLLRDQLGLPLPAGSVDKAPYKQARGMTVPCLRWRTEEDETAGLPGVITTAVTRRRRADTCKPPANEMQTETLATAELANDANDFLLSTGEREEEETAHMKASGDSFASFATSAGMGVPVCIGFADRLHPPSDLLPSADGSTAPEAARTLATPMDLATLLPWQQLAIQEAIAGGIPATIRLHPDMPTTISGKQIADFLQTPAIAAYIHQQRQQGEAA